MKTLFQRLMMNPTTGRPAPAPTPAPKSAPSQPQQLETCVIDARRLSSEDYERRLAQLGLTAPSTEYRRGQFGVGVPLHERDAQRDEARRLDRAGRKIDRQRARAESDRVAALEGPVFDGRTATAEQVRARLAQLGVNAVSAAITVSEVGRPLERSAPADTGTDHSTLRAEATETMRAVLDHCRRTGERLDVMKLNPWELAAYKALRGYDPT